MKKKAVIPIVSALVALGFLIFCPGPIQGNYFGGIKCLCGDCTIFLRMYHGQFILYSSHQIDADLTGFYKNNGGFEISLYEVIQGTGDSVEWQAQPKLWGVITKDIESGDIAFLRRDISSRKVRGMIDSLEIKRVTKDSENVYSRYYDSKMKVLREVKQAR